MTRQRQQASYREFYDDVTRRLDRSGVGEASFFSTSATSASAGDEARFEVLEGVFNPSPSGAPLVIGGADLRAPRAGRRVRPWRNRRPAGGSFRG
jgi:hypothetical protein